MGDIEAVLEKMAPGIAPAENFIDHRQEQGVIIGQVVDPCAYQNIQYIGDGKYGQQD